jgi:very-long-chain (3R)-3-hydroxyacyl-CoA dehydratase
MPIVSGQSKKPGSFSIKKAYLFAYNALSTTGWAYVLYITVFHILGATPAPPINPTAAETARNTIQRLIANIPLNLRNATPLTQAKVQIYNAIPPSLLTYLDRAKTLYSVVGLKVALVQSFAMLEVVHVLLGLVRSPLGTTAMQVASRLTLVWGIVENFAEVLQPSLSYFLVISRDTLDPHQSDLCEYGDGLVDCGNYSVYFLRIGAAWVRTIYYAVHSVGPVFSPPRMVI